MLRAFAAGPPPTTAPEVRDRRAKLSNAGAALHWRHFRATHSSFCVSDFYELDEGEALVRACAGRSSAALIARPWREGLPLGGFVRLRDAESDMRRASRSGQHKRERFVEAVAARERHAFEALLG